MKNVQSPCERCKRKPNCPRVCYPKRDWERGRKGGPGMTIEEIIKVLDEIAEGFENLSAEVCARNDLRALWEGRAKGIRQAIALLKTRPDAQPNELPKEA